MDKSAGRGSTLSPTTKALTPRTRAIRAGPGPHSRNPDNARAALLAAGFTLSEERGLFVFEDATGELLPVGEDLLKLDPSGCLDLALAVISAKRRGVEAVVETVSEEVVG